MTENSHRIELGEPLIGDFKAYSLVAGEAPTRRSAASRISLQLENAMIRENWPPGEPIASERALADRFGTSQETIREAIRILEQRGSMHMLRGRFGGLTPHRPGPEPAAWSLALYLRARGCSPAQLAAALSQIDPILARSAAARPSALPPPGSSLRRALATAAGSRPLTLYAALADIVLAPPPRMLASSVIDAAKLGDGERAATRLGEIALRFNQDWRPAGDARGCGLRSIAIADRLLARIMSAGMPSGRRIGSEWDLGSEFETCRSTIRQALGVLEDLELVEPRRGRGGGYVVKRPSPCGVVRHAHVFLSLGEPDPLPLPTVIDALNLVHLRLAAASLAPLSQAARRRRLDRLACLAGEGDPELRILKILEELGGIADNPLVDTLLRCVVAAPARANPWAARLAEPVRLAIFAHHRKVVDSLVAGDMILAERHFRAVQREMHSLGTSSGPAAVPPRG